MEKKKPHTPRYFMFTKGKHNLYWRETVEVEGISFCCCRLSDNSSISNNQHIWQDTCSASAEVQD